MHMKRLGVENGEDALLDWVRQFALMRVARVMVLTYFPFVTPRRKQQREHLRDGS